MDALKSLQTNIPDWVKRLHDLNGEIDERQLVLAKLTKPPSAEPAPRSLRNKGSTESLLKPDDNPETSASDMIMSESDVQQQTPAPASDGFVRPPPPLERPDASSPMTDPQPPSSPGGESTTPSALQRQTNQAVAVAEAKGIQAMRRNAGARKRHRTDSVISADGAGAQYRTRSMLIVYYDSYVQTFFEELVKFVSASRNLMRKAKMAAKVAQIKRLAELEVPDEEADGEKTPTEDTTGKIPAHDGNMLEAAAPIAAETDAVAAELPPLRYVSTARLRPMTGLLAAGRPLYTRAAARAAFGGAAAFAGGGVDQPPDVYDELDKCLEAVQSTCERAAHQFLRDGDCSDEIADVQRRLDEAKGLADREMERVRTEDPDALKPSDEPPKTRSFRPQAMRREPPLAKEDAPAVLEVDEGIDDMGDEMSKR